jgi:hypothetical protein
MFFGRGCLISELCDTTADPDPAHPAFFGDAVSVSRQLVTAQDDTCGQIRNSSHNITRFPE